MALYREFDAVVSGSSLARLTQITLLFSADGRGLGGDVCGLLEVAIFMMCSMLAEAKLPIVPL